MPQLLSLVGKALGSILRPPSSTDASGRARCSGDSDVGLDCSRRGRASEGHPAFEPPTSRSSGQSASLETLGTSTSQSAIQLCVAVARDAGATSTASGSHGRGSCGGAAVAAPPVGPGLANGGCSDAGNNSPPTAPQFFRASRASLCDATASAAGEALRQASVTTCKHFTRENYNNYVRWVRATRGAMKIAGQRRSRVEATARNPNPTLLLRCEHWLEVTDEQHRYGSNLRVYFDYWVAELEAAELTPPASPALMSPSPSYGHLAALAQPQQLQQHQQQLLAGAIATATAAMVERAATSTAGVGPATADPGRLPTEQQHQQLADRQPQQPIAVSVAAGTAATQNPDAQPLSPHQQLLPPRPLNEEQEQPWGQPGPQQASQCQGQNPGAAAGHSPGPGPSRFSHDAGAAPRAAVGGCPSDGRSSHPTQDGQRQEQQQQEQQRSRQLHGIKVHHHHTHHHHLQHTHHTHQYSHQHANRNHHHHNHNHHHNSNQTHQGSPALAAPAGAGEHEHGAPQLPQQQTEHGDGDGEEGGGEGDRTPATGDVPRSRSSRPHHGLDSDMELYERAGSLNRCTDDGGGSSPDGLPPGISTSSHRHDDGDEDGGGGPGGGAPISPGGPASGATLSRPQATVRFVVGSCEPQPTLLQRRHLRQQEQQQVQRRRSCGETDVPAARHPAAAQPRPSSDAVSITAAAVTAAAPATAAAAQPMCGSPRRSVLCSPSRRFMLAAMIDMSPAEGEQQQEQPEQLQQQQQQQPQKEGQEEAGEDGASLPGRHLQQGGAAGGGGGAAGLAAAAQGSCAAAAGDGAGGGGGGAPPATPQSRDGQLPAAALLPPPTTPAQNSCGAAGVTGSCTALRAAKLLSNRPSVGSGTSFFRWLDNGPGLDVDLAHLGVSRGKLDAERVKYLTPVELLEYELDVDIETGLLRYKRSGKLLHTGPDGRGSLDEHRRPPTPPPPAVPLALLGESAAAWWGRGSAATGAAAAEPLPSTPPALCAPVAVPLLPLRNPPAAVAGARQSCRRVAAMGTLPEGAGGDGGSACEEVPGQSSILAGLDNPVANAAAVGGRCVAVATEEAVTEGVRSAGGTAAAAASPLPDLEVRGHSASSLARLERTRDACYPGKDDPGGVTPGGSGSGSAAGSGCSTGCGSGDCDGGSGPCDPTVTGLAAAGAAADAPGAAAVRSISGGDAAGDGGGRGVLAPSLAGSLAAGIGIVSRATDGLERFADHAASAAAKAKAAAVALNEQLKRQVGEVAAALQIPGVHHAVSPGRPMGLDGAVGARTPPAAPSPTAAVASSVGGGGGGGGGLAAASSGMPRTPVAVPLVGSGAGGVYPHEEKVAKWIYVVDPELRLFVHPKVRGRFHHSSFLRGGAVVAAGGLAARHGRLRLLTADSGHYWPREENFRWLCEHLVYVGADLSACELKSKHMPVPAATGRELMEKMGVPPPWRLSYQPASSPSGAPAALESSAFGGGGGGADAPPSPLAEHMHLLQLQDAQAQVEEVEDGSEAETEGQPPSSGTKTTTRAAGAVGAAAAIRI